MVLRSALLSRLGVPHGFTTRIGGVSSGMFESLNFGNPGDLARDRKDPGAHIRENQRRVLHAIGAHTRRVVEVWQMHGAEVALKRPNDAWAWDGEGDHRADAIVTDDPACIIGVRIADCAPILLASADGSIVSTVHAGWRGVIAGVLPRAIDAMHALGAAPRSTFAAIGMCIGVESFEVGEEVAAEFTRVFPEANAIVRRDLGHKPHIDLKLALAVQLQHAGLPPESIETLPHCTVRDERLFFSHRRQAALGGGGRMLALIGPRE